MTRCCLWPFFRPIFVHLSEGDITVCTLDQLPYNQYQRSCFLPVDRILRHQKVERQAIEDAQASQKGTLASDIDVLASDSQFASEPSLDKERCLAVPGGFENKPTPSASVFNSFQSFRRKIGTSLNANAAQGAKTPSASEQDLQTDQPQRPVSPSPVDPLKSSEQPIRFERPAGPHVAPKSNICSSLS